MDSSLKWRPLWKVWIPISLFLIPLILEGEMAGTTFTPYVYGLIVFIYGVVYYFRIRMWEVLVLMSFMAITIWWYFLAERAQMTYDSFLLIGIDPGPEVKHWIEAYITTASWFAALFINFVIFYTLGPKLMKALELEKNAIRLFKLSARQMYEEKNGYTARPFNAGKHPFKKEDLFGFSSFVEDKKICLALFPGNGVKFVFSMGTSPLIKSRQEELSHVFFNSNGELSVFISARDYRQYRKKYTFDQLCDIMGKTFLRFAKYYNTNNERKIITELRSA